MKELGWMDGWFNKGGGEWLLNSSILSLQSHAHACLQSSTTTTKTLQISPSATTNPVMDHHSLIGDVKSKSREDRGDSRLISLWTCRREGEGIGHRQ